MDWRDRAELERRAKEEERWNEKVAHLMGLPDDEDDRPRTVADFVLLPEGPAWLIEDVLNAEGRPVRRVLPVPTQAFFVGPEDLLQVVDDDGVRWTLGRYASGLWFKARHR